MTTPAPNIFTPIGGRRFFITLLLSIFALWLVLIDKLSGGEWIGAMTMILGYYTGSNTLQKVKEIGSEHQ